jgi:uncharacterized OB-fold protein
LRVGVPGHPPPQSVAYVTLDDGPRILVHASGDRPLPVDARVRLVSSEHELRVELLHEGTPS